MRLIAVAPLGAELVGDLVFSLDSTSKGIVELMLLYSFPVSDCLKVEEVLEIGFMAFDIAV
jgi:hypothetical protein